MEEPTIKEESKKFNLLEWTTIIYAFLTLLGYSYIDFYYKCWGISIYSYLDSSEIILSFMNLLNTYLGYLFYFGIGIIFVFSIPKTINIIKKISNKGILFKVLMIANLIVLLINLLLYTNILILPSLIIDGFSFNIKLFFTTMIVALTYNYLLNYSKKVFSTLLPTINIKLFIVAYIIIFANILVYINASNQHYDIIKNYTSTYFSFNYESIPYKSNDTLLYIGSTSKYIFIRNTKDSANLIFDKSNIKNLSIIEKRNTNK